MKAWLKGGLIFVVINLFLRIILSLNRFINGFILRDNFNLYEYIRVFFYNDGISLEGILNLIIMFGSSFIFGAIIVLIYNRKKLPLYLRTGIIGILFLFFQIFNGDYRISNITEAMRNIISKYKYIFWPNDIGQILSLIILYFIIGALMGFLIGKIKSKNQNTK